MATIPSGHEHTITTVYYALHLAMSFLLNTLITLLALAATSVLLPSIPLGFFRFGLRGVGWFIQKRTRSRKEFIISRVRADEEEFQAKRDSAAATAASGNTGKSSPSTSQAEDEDWEKVNVGTAGNNQGNGHKQKDGTASGGDENFKGIIGFIHPFWYAVVSFSGCEFISLT